VERTAMNSIAKRGARHLIVTMTVALAALAPPVMAQEAARAARLLAPTGALRLAMLPANSLSRVEDARTGARQGVAHDLAQLLAQRLGVKVEIKRFQTTGEVMEAMASGRADLAMVSAPSGRVGEADFSRPLLNVELGFLVPPGSGVRTGQDLDQPGARIGVAAGSSSQHLLPPLLRDAQLVPTQTLADGVALLKAGKIDAYATDKVTLYELADVMPGSRVLDEKWGIEALVLVVPKGRSDALAFIDDFVSNAISSGEVARSATAAGLRGYLAPAIAVAKVKNN
ncbi:MAG: transporter substrate-binding domain-containing protein, partial [Variovorax sp.]